MIEVIDNFLEEDIFLKVQEFLYTKVQWKYGQRSVGTSVSPDSYDQMYHMFFRSTDGKFRMSKDLHEIAPVLNKIQPYVLIRAKANMTAPYPLEEAIGFHVDNEVPSSMTGVFYFSTDDGYTIFENGDEVKTVANRLLKFPTYMKHSLKRHTSGKNRVVLNINWIDYNVI